ncbi:MAG TPA: VOC family protein [Candidatus Saccharimonadales bacterium]|nr:VOC family protein [Candidatus Saccharimonadales bacterium]
MITATHVVVYADDPEQARAFVRDVLEMANVDIHGGWLIFQLPPAELGVHPAGEGSPGGHHELFLMCDDIDRTVAELTAKGADFSVPISTERFGRLTRMRIPGGGEIGLYQPSHPTAYGLER